MLIKESWPVGAASTLKIVWQQGPLLVLAGLDLQAVGLFNAANRIPQQVLIMNASMYPVLSRIWVSDRSRYFVVLNRAVVVSCMLAVPVVVIAVAAAPYIVPLLFGAQFQEAVGPFILLMLVVGTLFPSIMMAEGLNAAKCQGAVLIILIALTPVLVALLLVLVPEQGAWGAALALLIVHVAYCLAFVAAARWRMGAGAPLRALGRAGIAMVVALGALTLTSFLGPIVSGCVGTMVGLAILWASGPPVVSAISWRGLAVYRGGRSGP
jgi:O-antigen/teichoic acid export membrane protein